MKERVMMLPGDYEELQARKVACDYHTDAIRELVDAAQSLVAADRIENVHYHSVWIPRLRAALERLADARFSQHEEEKT